MLYITAIKDRDLLWFSLWITEFKKRYGSCIDFTKPVWGSTNKHWTLSGLRLRDVNTLVDVTLLFSDGRFGYICSGFSFGGVVCERKILHGRDLMEEIITYAKSRTGISMILRADSLENDLESFLSTILQLGDHLTALNPSIVRMGTCNPVTIAYESKALTTRTIAEELAKRGSRTVTYLITSTGFDSLDGFRNYLEKYLKRNFSALVSKNLGSRFKFSAGIKQQADHLVFSLTVLAH